MPILATLVHISHPNTRKEMACIPLGGIIISTPMPTARHFEYETDGQTLTITNHKNTAEIFEVTILYS